MHDEAPDSPDLDAPAGETSADAADPAGEATEAAVVDPERLDALAGQLIWRIGRSGDEGPVTVRVGLASAAPAFSDLPKLRSASDAELREAIDAGDLRVEWVGTGR